MPAVVGEFALTKENRRRMGRLAQHGCIYRWNGAVNRSWPERTRLLWHHAERACNTQEQHDRLIVSWRALAAPLRRAREERQRAREDAKQWMETAMVVFGRSKAVLEKGEEYRDSLFTLMLGAALLAFFTDLAILVRRTPSPCPWCGWNASLECDSESWWCMCDDTDGDAQALCAVGPKDVTEYHAITAWNRVAIPAAFARLKDGE